MSASRTEGAKAHDPPAMLDDAGINVLPAVPVQVAQGAFLVGTHEPAVPGDISPLPRSRNDRF
jgi:hypothetical protein